MLIIKIGTLCIPTSGNTTPAAAIKKAKRTGAQSFSIYRAEKIYSFAVRHGKYYDVTPRVTK